MDVGENAFDRSVHLVVGRGRFCGLFPGLRCIFLGLRSGLEEERFSKILPFLWCETFYFHSPASSQSFRAFELTLREAKFWISSLCRKGDEPRKIESHRLARFRE